MAERATVAACLTAKTSCARAVTSKYESGASAGESALKVSQAQGLLKRISRLQRIDWSIPTHGFRATITR